MADHINRLLKELEWESEKTRKTLLRIPEDKFSWQPHEKSRPLGRLASHIAELPGWIPFVLHEKELDFNKPVTFLRHEFHSKKELMDFFERTLSEAKNALHVAKDDDLKEEWLIRKGDSIFVTATKGDIIRRMSLNHVVHHRAQLGVYLRLLNEPVPATYGPSADEQGF